MRHSLLVTAVALALTCNDPAWGQCFRRADSNCDLRFDLSDPVHTLNWLFIGGGEPCCLDGADSNDDGLVNISDPIYSLSYLFLGGPSPPAPFPGCGRDAGADGLTCNGYPGCPQTSDCFLPNRPPSIDEIPDAAILAGAELVVQASAADPDGDALVFALLLAPAGMSISPSGELRWTPAAGQLGDHDVTVVVRDTAGAEDFTSFSVRVRGENTAPEAAGDSFVARMGETLQVAAPGILENDSDADGDELQIELIDGPTNGALNLRADGSFSYTPARPGFEGRERRRAERENLVLLAAPEILASSSGLQCPTRGCDPEAAADGELGTSWLSIASDAAPFYEVRFEDEDVDVREVRIFGNREQPAGFDVLEGIVAIYARDGEELYSSGAVPFPEPDRDLALDVGLIRGVHRVRLSITAREGSRAGISEMQVLGDGTVRSLEVALKWAWEESTVQPNHRSVLSTPAVIDLDGDAMPEIVFPAGQGVANGGYIRALRGQDGSEVFITHISRPVTTFTSIATGDIDGDGRPEIVAWSRNSTLIAFEHDGAFKWEGERVAGTNWGAVSIADLDADGSPELFLGNQVCNALGVRLWTGERLSGLELSIASDIDLDGKLELIDGVTVYRADGRVAWSNPLNRANAAVGNFDDDAFGEVVAATTATIELYEHDGSRLWSYAGSRESMGAPTVADFDGDGQPEVGVARRSRYVVVDTGGTLLWERPIEDNSSAVTGSSVFDFDGDGIAEVVSRDEVYFRVFRGTDGRVLMRKRFHSATAHENPMVADVDNDGHADIVVPGDHAVPIPAVRPPGLKSGIYVYTGVRNDWVRTRPIWNQHSYHVTNVNLDGTIPVQERANWLVPGLNHFRLNDFLPEEEGSADRFTYRVTDGSLRSEVVTVYIEVRPPNSAPEVVSPLRATATRGFQYLELVRAVDADRDAVTFTLPQAPPGMTIDVNGIIRWTPETTGEFPVAVRVEDDDGAAGFGRVLLAVVDPVEVPDVLGRDEAAATSLLTAAGLGKGAVASVTHPTVAAGLVAAQAPPPGAAAEPGALVAISISAGPAPGDVDADGDSISPNQGDCDDTQASVYPGAPETAGDGIDQDCDGDDASLPPVDLILEPAALALVAGETAALEAYAIGAAGESRRVNAAAAWSSSGPAASVDASGIVTAVSTGAISIDVTYQGLVRTAAVTVAAEVAGDVAPPIAEIHSPLAGEGIAGQVTVLGTATDPSFVRYELALAPAGDPHSTILATGDEPVQAGPLGTLDATVLVNDLYDLRLTVFDAGGNRATTSVAIQVDGNQKPGIFTIAFTDLVVPLSGLPITLRRVYDSRDKERRDFGIGWRLDLQSVRVRTSRILGTGWVVGRSGLAYRLSPATGATAIVQGSGGLFEQFDLVLTPSASAIVPLQTVHASFRARPGSAGTLEILDNTSLALLDPQPGPAQLYDDETFEVFNPQLFRYTAPSGLSLVIDRRAGLRSARDPNGNTLSFGPGGIEHSAGAAVAFERDAEGRITAVRDPNGNVQTYAYDTAGDLRTHTDAEGAVTRFAYGRDHHLVQIGTPAGAFVRNEYDDSGRLIASTDGAGNRIELQLDLDEQTLLETDVRGNSSVLRFDASGNVISRERHVTIEGVLTAVHENYVHDALGNEIEETDADGRVTRREYQGDDLTRVIRDPGGLNIVESSSHDQRGNVIAQSDAVGGVTRFDYDSRGNATSFTDATGATTSLVHDSAGRLLRRQDALGSWTAYTHDGLGRVTRTESFNAQGVLLARRDATHDANGNLLTETAYRDPAAAAGPLVSRYTYDGNNRRLTAMDPLGNVTRFEYGPGGQVASVTDPRGSVTRFQHDARGLLVRTDHAGGAFETFRYDAAGNRIESIDAVGRSTRYVHDELNRLVETIRPDGASFRSVYSPGGLLAATIDWNGQRTDFEYDAAGREIRRLGPEALDGTTGTRARPETIQERDPAGRVRAVIQPTGARTQLTHDALGRITGVQHAGGASTRVVFDAAGRTASETDEDGRTTQYEYDGLGRLIAVISPPAAAGGPAIVTRHAYDGLGNLTATTDALGRTTIFDHDGLGRLVRRTLPGGESESFTYDAAGNILTRTAFRGELTTFEHDARNRLTARRFEDGTEHTFTHSPAGFRTAINDGAGETRFEGDLNDQVAAVIRPDGRRITYTRDASGNVTGIATAERTISYAYDELGRLQSVNSPEGVFEYFQDLAGNLVKLVAPNGVETEVERDARGRVVGIVHSSAARGVLAALQYVLSGSGLRLRQQENDGSVETYAYDGLGRLVEEARTGRLPRRVSYELDAVGNRLRRVADGVETVYSYDLNDRLVARTGATFQYDANGNRTAKIEGGATTRYAWDALDRLIAVETAAGTTAMTYDADGNRLRVAGPAGIRSHLVDTLNPTGLSQTLEERDGAGNLAAAYTRGGSLLAMAGAGGPLFHHADAHGSTRLVTRASGEPAGVLGFEAFGAGVEGNAVPTPYRYAGERLDADLDLYHLRARAYDPEEGIFLGMDPLLGTPRDPASLHPFLYARASPVSFVDPTGLMTVPEVSLVQTVQTGMKAAEIGGKAVKVCKLSGQLQLVDAVFLATHLTTAVFLGIDAISGLTNPGSRQAVNQEVVIFKLSNPEDKATLKPNEWVDVDVRVNPGKPSLVVGGTQAPDKKFTLEVSPSGVSTSAGLSPELAVFKSCGVDIAKLELKLRFGTSVSKTGFKARASVGLELKTFGDGLKQTFPWFAVEVGNTAGFSSAASFNVRLVEMTPNELAELFRD